MESKSPSRAPAGHQVLLPDAPAMVAGVRGAVWLSPDGEVESLSLAAATERLRPGSPPIVCHGRGFFSRLGARRFPAFDLLELFAFVRPAEFALPTPRGLADALGLALPTTMENEAASLVASAQMLLSELAAGGDKDAVAIAWAMQRGAWPWAETVLAALGAGNSASQPHSRNILQGLAVWKRIPEWQDQSDVPPPGDFPVEPVEARAQLVRLLGPEAEERPEQSEYAGAITAGFAARDRAGMANVVLADAGTGVGKTLGYIAPASVWAEKNDGAVWVSTFTRNLQRQLDGELDRLYPDATEKLDKVVIRKGRENYFCLLNFAEAVGRVRSGAGDEEAVALGLMARWAGASRDGDMIGGDFPAWLSDLLGRGATLDLTDKRGECTYSACEHYGRCFVERTIRRARHARIVVANHALVMVQAALGGGEEGSLPTRYVFDEGHHVFGAADSAFSADLTGYETEDLRRWIVGAEAGRRSRSRGLKLRIGDLIAGDDEAMSNLDEALRAAHALPGPAWRGRLGGGEPIGATEVFLAHVRTQVYARDKGGATYSLEAGTEQPVPGLLDAAGALQAALARLRRPLQDLIRALVRLLDVEADTLDTATRNRIDALARGLQRRGVEQLGAWMAMLKSLHGDLPDEFIDWFSIERIDGRETDIGLHRHWIDPTKPFADTVLSHAHGAVITSATLLDDHPESHPTDIDEESGIDVWAGAEARTGAAHLAAPASHVAVSSPFNYASHTRVLVVGDVDKTDTAQVAAAYRELFLASGGGGLGLFTAISRMRAVHERIAGPLDEAGIEVLAQHIDEMDTGTLIDIFRAEENSCLLGTDAVRDGVDVPGRSLRLIVFDRVPWPRPDILHKARRKAFGGRSYDEMLTRLKLKQAYGRLLRRAGDRGVFVMLDRALPTRLLSAFPDGVDASRVGLKEAIMEIRAFLAEDER
ncbi:MAG: ATP-dependent DNA helicase [Rhodospirillaceae bacterium]|nr:ATP-dependent DNA helicase [Rhodospirillaceae bacterium]